MTLGPRGRIIRRALEESLRQMAQNAGLEPAVASVASLMLTTQAESCLQPGAGVPRPARDRSETITYVREGSLGCTWLKERSRWTSWCSAQATAPVSATRGRSRSRRER